MSHLKDGFIHLVSSYQAYVQVFVVFGWGPDKALYVKLDPPPK